MFKARLSERQRKNIGFSVIALAWVMTVILIIENYSQNSRINTDQTVAELNKVRGRLRKQEDYIKEVDKLFREIKRARFDIYQDYMYGELLEKVNDLDPQKNRIEMEETVSKTYEARGSEILKLLLYARQELVKQEENFKLIEKDLQNAREGNSIRSGN